MDIKFRSDCHNCRLKIIHFIAKVTLLITFDRLFVIPETKITIIHTSRRYIILFVDVKVRDGLEDLYLSNT